MGVNGGGILEEAKVRGLWLVLFGRKCVIVVERENVVVYM